MSSEVTEEILHCVYCSTGISLVWGFTRARISEINSSIKKYSHVAMRPQEAALHNLCSIMKTCPCDLYPLTHHFYIVNWGVQGYTFFLFLL